MQCRRRSCTSRRRRVCKSRVKRMAMNCTGMIRSLSLPFHLPDSFWILFAIFSGKWALYRSSTKPVIVTKSVGSCMTKSHPYATTAAKPSPASFFLDIFCFASHVFHQDFFSFPPASANKTLHTASMSATRLVDTRRMQSMTWDKPLSLTFIDGHSGSDLE